MASVTDALRELNITEWSLVGEPASQEELNTMFRKIIGTDDNGSAILSSDPSDFGVDWNTIETKLNELNAAEPLKLLRVERNVKLAETDWVVTMHKELGTNIPAAWKTYRQALRDITDTYTSLDDVVWPEKP